MDELDQKLVAELTANARLPVATLAKRLGVARSTVQVRLERLETSGTIAGYTTRLGAAARRGTITATALIQVEPRATAGVLQRLKPLRQITEAHTTSGRFDLILRLTAASTEELDAMLDTIGALPGVRGSESLIHLSTKINRSA